MPEIAGPGARAHALHRAWVDGGGDRYYGELFWEGVVANFAVIARYAEYVMDGRPIHGHGYTCGTCSWGRDGKQDRTYWDYLDHRVETGHDMPEEGK